MIEIASTEFPSGDFILGMARRKDNDPKADGRGERGAIGGPGLPIGI